jgi:hypothetical protein
MEGSNKVMLNQLHPELVFVEGPTICLFVQHSIHLLSMKLQQYTQSFAEPLRAEDAHNLTRLLSCRNKTARGLSDTTGPVDVSSLALAVPLPTCTRADGQERKFSHSHPVPGLEEPWGSIALRHVAAVHTLYSNQYQRA